MKGSLVSKYLKREEFRKNRQENTEQFYDKVDMCLARYSPRAEANNAPTSASAKF